MLLLLSIAGCFFSMPEQVSCTDPHLWYAPDGSGDTYFGCAPPEGWSETPPDESAYAASTQTTTVGPEPDIDTDEPDVDTGEQTVVFPPRDTAPPKPVVTGDTGSPPDTALPDPEDTALPPEDTGLDTGAAIDTSDTGAEPIEPGELPPTGDTGLPAARVGDTAPPLPDDTGLVIVVPVPDDDTGTP